jgi:hypothetical protein
LSGQAEKSLPLVAKAIELEPEYADRFYEVRADVNLALGKSPEALRDINIASELPHLDRSAIERFNLKTSAVRRRIEAARREADYKELEALRREVRAEAERREPPPKPTPPPPPAPAGIISYQIETRAPIEVVDAIYPDYPEELQERCCRIDHRASGRRPGRQGKVRVDCEFPITGFDEDDSGCSQEVVLQAR